MSFGRRILILAFAVLAFCAASSPAGLAAQGVTTGGIGGVVTGAQKQPVAGASVIAIHEPSGTSYEATTRADGRYSIPAMRVGGPYTVQVVYTGGGGAAFAPKTVENINISLGVTSDVDVSVEAITVAEEVEVTGVSDPVFASTRTGAATSVGREDIATLPTISGRLESVTRLTPQASGTSFGGQDNRLNNITVDGSYFNNSFGLGSQPGERTNVAPISLESLEQVQVSIAPFDVRQGNFIGAAINSVTRSGTNQFSAFCLSPDAQRRFRRHRGARPDGQSRHLHVPRHRLLGGRPDHPQQALRVRQLRERGRQAAAAHVPCEQRRRADRWKRHARARVRPQHAELVPVAELPV